MHATTRLKCPCILMHYAHAWSMLSKLLLADTTDGTITLTVTQGGDLILTPQDARLTVVSGPYTGSCFRDGTVLFKLGTVRVPLCDLPVQTLPLVVRYKNTTLYTTDEEWVHEHADNLNAAAPVQVPVLHHAFKSLHPLQQTEGDVRQLLSHVFPLPLASISVQPIPETLETTQDVLDALAAEMAMCEDELLCVAMQAIAHRFGCELDIPAAAVAATDAAMAALPELAAYEPLDTQLSLSQLRTYVGPHNFDVSVQSVYLERDISKQTQMRIAARERGGLMCPRATPPLPQLLVNGQHGVTEAQPHDQLRVENVGVAQVFLDGACVKCVPGGTVFVLEKCGLYSINNCITLSVAYNIANVGSWKVVTDEAFQHIQIVADDKYTTVEALEATRWRFQSNVHARFNTVTVPLSAKGVGVYCIENFGDEMWKLVSVSGADLAMQVCYGRLSTSKLWVNVSAALSASDRPVELGYAVLGSKYGDLFQFIDPAVLNRARTVCQGGLWSQSDGKVQSASVPTASFDTTASWLTNECELQYGTCKMLVPGTLEALRGNEPLLPFVLSNGEPDQLVGFTTLPLPQYMPLYVSSGPLLHNLSGIELKWADGFRVLVLECGLHLCSEPARHERLVCSDAEEIQVQVTHPEPTCTVLMSEPGCFAFVLEHKTYIYNVLPNKRAFVIHGIVSEPQAAVTLAMHEAMTPFFTQKPACVPLDMDTHEITTCWGTALRGVDVLEGRLGGLLPPFTGSASLVLHPSCNTRTPSGLVAPSFQHDLFSCLFTTFGYDPDALLPWSVFPVYEPTRISPKFRQLLIRALCNNPVSMMACFTNEINPYPGTTMMQLRIPASVLVTHTAPWTPVSLTCVVDGCDVFIRGLCITEQGALYAAIRDLPEGHSHCIALDSVPNDSSLCSAVQLFLRCFLVGEPISITLPALLWEKEAVPYEEDYFIDDI